MSHVNDSFDGQTEELNALVAPEYWRDVNKSDVAVLRLENMPEAAPDMIFTPTANLP